jgi:hypothetical protein
MDSGRKRLRKERPRDRMLHHRLTKEGGLLLMTVKILRGLIQTSANFRRTLILFRYLNLYVSIQFVYLISLSEPRSRSPQNVIDGDTIIWKDPTTRETFIVDTRTGNSYPQEAPVVDGNGLSVKRRTLQTSEWLKKTKDPCSIEDVAEDNRAMPNWLQQALQVREACIFFCHL